MSTEARARADRIRDHLAELVERRDDVLGLIRKARDERDDEALGYPSWPAYVAGEFGGLLPKLQVSERQPLAATMRSLGMSSESIAPVLGVSGATIRRDLSGRANAQPEVPLSITGLDGKTYATSRPVPTSPPPDADDERRRAAWQPFRALMSDTVRQFIDGTQALVDGHDWGDLDSVHARYGIDSRDVVLDRLRAMRDAADQVLAAWDDSKPALRRVK